MNKLVFWRLLHRICISHVDSLAASCGSSSTIPSSLCNLEDMATTEDRIHGRAKSKWYQALFEEDCAVVMGLLDAEPSLLKVGWKSEPSRQVEGRKRRERGGWTQSSWKGRTALHVGASRGCMKLIMQVLRICNLDGFSEVNAAYERSLLYYTNADTHASNLAEQSSPRIERLRASPRASPRSDPMSDDYVSDMDRRRLLLAKDGESGLDALAIAVLHGKKDLIGLLRYCAGKLNDQSHYDRISIDAEEVSLTFTRSETGVREKRKLLRQITVAAVMAFIEIVEPYLNREDEEDDLIEDADESVDSHGLPPFQSEDGPVFGPPPSTLHRRAFDEYMKVHGADALHRRAFDEYINLHDASTMFSLDEVSGHWVFKEYFEHRDFNFLPPEEYLFHFLCAIDWIFQIEILITLWLAIRSWQGDDDLWRFLLELTDGQGRPPFHVAIEESHVAQLLMSLTIKTDDSIEAILAMTLPDEAGRTPVHRAAATGRLDSVKILVEHGCKFDEVAATCHASWASSIQDWGSSWAHDFQLIKFPLAQTPLHAALLNRNFSCAKLLLKTWREQKWGDITYRSRDEVVMNSQESFRISGVIEWIEWDIVELACLVGAPLTFIELLKDDLTTPRLREETKEATTSPQEDPAVTFKHQWHPLHLAASLGRYDLLKFFIDDLQCDPFIEDFEGNSTLHHAMKVREFELGTHLLDYVNAEHYSLSKHNRASMAKEEILNVNRIAERQGCINLLLQVGCDVFRTNKRRQIPYPTGSLKDNKFLSWWYDKQEKEFSAARNNLNFATNAIAVTATLVATASYVGPLQPPLGYDSNHIQYQNVWVIVFIVCDTLSFYLAIVAITFSLIPSLPMPQQAMLEEIQRTREMVIMAVGILLPSIFFVFVAFACSSISVMSPIIFSEVGGIFTIVTTVLGIFLCLFAFLLFSIRLLAFIFPKNNSIRYVYNLSFVSKLFSNFLSRD